MPEHWTPAAVHKLLSDEPRYKGRVPSLRSVERIFKDALPKSGSDPWRMEDSEGEEAALIMPVIGALMESTNGRLSGITRAFAEWIVRVRLVAPDLHPLSSATVALEYLRLSGEEESERPGQVAFNRRMTTLLDIWLGYAPWRSVARAESYQKILDDDDDQFAERPGTEFEDIENLELVRRGLIDKSQFIQKQRINQDWYAIVLRDEVQDD